MLLDTDGRPLRATDTARNAAGTRPVPDTEEQATGQLTGIRSIWGDMLPRGLTPLGVVSILERAACGDAQDYLTLAEEMEERDAHYGGVLGTRKRAVEGLSVMVRAASDSAADQKVAEAVRALVARPAFRTLRKGVLDALGKGYSVSEIRWQRGATWEPVTYEWRDPRWFQFDRTDGRTLRLRDGVDPVNGVPLKPYLYVTHVPQLKCGLPIRGGLARAVAFLLVCKWYAQKDWNAFAEVFGLPIRIGRYGPDASKGDIAILRRAIAAIGTDAGAILPDSMKIDFQEVKATGSGVSIFQALCDWIDRQISKLVLGQTTSADAQATGLGSGVAAAHAEVRTDILVADAQDADETINRDLVRTFVDINFGPQTAYPVVEHVVPQRRNLTELATVLEKLVPMGLDVEVSVVRDLVGLPDPGEDAVLLRGPARPAPALNRRRFLPALNARGADGRDRVDDYADRMEELAGAVDGISEPVRRLVANARSLEDIRDGIAALAQEMDGDTLGTLLREGLTAAWLAGMSDVAAAAPED